jgi:hypothetical protein
MLEEVVGRLVEVVTHGGEMVGVAVRDVEVDESEGVVRVGMVVGE